MSKNKSQVESLGQDSRCHLLLFGICASLGKNLSRKIWTGIGPIVKPEVWTAILYTSLWMGMFEVEVCMMWCGGKYSALHNN